MTIKKLLDKVNEEVPNTFTEEKLISFINEIEHDVAEQLCEDFATEYTTEDMDTELMATRPYDRLYVSYLKAMIDYSNQEYASYQNNQAQHTQDFRDFVDWVVRNDQATDSAFPTRIRNIM